MISLFLIHSAAKYRFAFILFVDLPVTRGFMRFFWNLSESALEEESLERQQRQISLHFACQFSFRRRMFLQLKEWWFLNLNTLDDQTLKIYFFTIVWFLWWKLLIKTNKQTKQNKKLHPEKGKKRSLKN